MDRFPHKLIGGGAAMLALVTALGWGGFSMVIRGQMKQQAKLWNKTDTWRNWQDSPSPYYLRIYMFNVDNADAVVKGAKPKLTQKGPYVYVETRWKEDIEFDKGNDTLVYKQMKRYSYVGDLSGDGLKEEDMITTLNIPLVGVARIAQDSSNDKDKLLSAISSSIGEKAFITHSVKDLLFEGYDVSKYIEFEKQHGGAMAEVSDGAFAVPSYIIDTGKYSLFKNRNATEAGVWEIWTGRTNASAFGLIKTWNGEDTLPWWSKGEPCHFMNGTDGTMFTPPMLKKTRVLSSYETEYCRSRKYERDTDTSVKELKTVRYRPKKQHSLSPANNAENACFCPYEDLSKCGKDGVENLGPCMEGVPMFISNGHFFGGDEELVNGVEGLMPEQDKHEPYLDIDPISGWIMEGKRRWQISVEVEPVPKVSSLASMPKAFIPVYWIEESFIAPDKKFALMKFLAMLQMYCDSLRWGLLAAAAGILVFGLLVAIMRRGSSKVDKITLLQ